MNKKRIAQYCCAALVVAGIGLNIQNAIENYGIGENSFSLVATGGSNSGSNSSASNVSNLKYTCESSVALTEEDWYTTTARIKVLGGYIYVGALGDGRYIHKKKITRYYYGRSCNERKGALETLEECRRHCKSDAGVPDASN